MKKIISTKLLLSFAFLILFVSEAIALPRVGISLQNKRIDNGYYCADVWASIPNVNFPWKVSSTTILIQFNNSALAMDDVNGIEMENIDFDLFSNGYTSTQTLFADDQLSVNLFTMESKVTKTGSFRIGTIKWKIVDGSKLDGLQFYTKDIEIFNGMEQMLDYGCDRPDCYEIQNPIISAVNEAVGSKTELGLKNSPNPFNRTTQIEFEISNASNIEIKVYSMNGQLIKTLTDNFYTPGSYSLPFNGENLPSGVYTVVLMVDGKQITHRMILDK